MVTNKQRAALHTALDVVLDLIEGPKQLRDGAGHLSPEEGEEVALRLYEGQGPAEVRKAVPMSKPGMRGRRDMWIKNAAVADKRLLQRATWDEHAAALNVSVAVVKAHVRFRTGQKVDGKAVPYAQKYPPYRVEINGEYVQMFPISA